MVKTRSLVKYKPTDMSLLTEDGSFDPRFEAALKKLIKDVFREELALRHFSPGVSCFPLNSAVMFA